MDNIESRFSLLLLEPYEIYFEDFFADMLVEPSSDALDGKLKICSKSVVFEPKQIDKPLTKINYKDCLEISGVKGQNFENKTLQIVTQHYVEMLDGNIISPFKFHNKARMNFTFVLKYVSTDECLPKIQQLQRASTLPIYEQNSMIATIAFSWHNRIAFDPLWFESIYEKVIIESTVNHIKPLVTNPGRLLLTNSLLYFQSFNNIQTNPVLKINLSSISALTKRRFMLKQIGLEIEYTDESHQKVLYVAFISNDIRDKFYDAISQQESFQVEDLNCDSMIIKWQHGDVSNYDYLLYLNSLADRSFNDLTQYPVFPWVIKDYTSEEIDLNDLKVYRNLSKPIGALNEDRLGKLKERCTEMDEPKYLYGSMFSMPGSCIFYLARRYPELMLCLQNGKFDHPDRIFNSVQDTFNNCMTNMSDFKELTPEFYDVSKCDFLINKKKINFGQRWDGSIVNNVQLPPWAKRSAEKFVRTLREALESDYVSANINNWIDLIFGYKQRGEEAFKADNLFYHLCYEGSVNLSDVSDMAAKHALEVQILEFGQIPKQLFTTPHPQKLIHLSKMSLSDSVSAIKPLNTELVKVFDGFRDAVLGLSCSDDVLIATGKDGSLKCYNVKSHKQIRNVQVSDFPLSACVKFANSSQIVCSSWDNTIVTYSLDYGRVCGEFEAHDDSITCLKGITVQNQNFIVSGSSDCYVKIWKWSEEEVVNKRNRLFECLAVDDKINCIDVKTNKNNHLVIIIGCKNGDIIEWDYDMNESNKIVKRVMNGESECVQLKYHKNGLNVAACFVSKMILIDCSTTMSLFCFSRNIDLTCLEWLSDNILIGDSAGRVSIVNLTNGNIVHEFEAHDTVNCILAVETKSSHSIVTSGVHQNNFCIKIWQTDL